MSFNAIIALFPNGKKSVRGDEKITKYEVKAVVCDYGIYENGELKLVVNSRGNALLIKAILEQDL